MEQIHPLWSQKRQQLYTEVALIVAAKGESEHLTDYRIVGLLSEESRDFVIKFAHGPDETFRDTFMEDVLDHRIIAWDRERRSYALEEWGHVLVTAYLDDKLD